MKSKSFDLKKSPAEKGRHNKTFDFVGFYKSAAETNDELLKNSTTVENLDKENSFGTPASAKKRERSPNKKKRKEKGETLDTPVQNVDGPKPNSKVKRSHLNGTRATSTPNASKKLSAEPKVKSIMKNSSVNEDESMEEYAADTPTFKSKKRNKSVSFMLDDTEEIATKKTKSNESINTESPKSKSKASKVFERKKLKKMTKSLQAEKENKGNVNMEIDPNTEVPEKKSKKKSDKNKIITDVDNDVPAESTSDPQTVPDKAQDKKKKLKKMRKRKKAEDNCEPAENDSNNNEDSSEHKPKKVKKKKITKSVQAEGTDEPAANLKKEVKPEVIAEDLENLSIGDNAHTLTNLLDEMTVVDKDKKKKNKIRRKKEKASKSASVSSSETADLEKIEEGKEKVKWKKRKWNKDKKGDVDDDIMVTSVIVENLPLKVMCTYKKVLADHFGSLGLIKKIGIAEVYPTEEPKPVFTTTIIFYSEDAATKALEEDNAVLEGSRIRVRRPLPPAQTTLVARSYADVTEQSLSSVFSAAGRIRSIRLLIKGKKTISTAFIEFDGPEAVERALKMAEDAKIGSKKIHVAKFEQRGTKSKRKEQKKKADSENEGEEGDSENSND